MSECKICGKPTDNGLGLCRQCFSESLTDVERNILNSGEFHGLEWEARVERLLDKEEPL